MSNRVKIELIAELLRSSSHEVEIISQGEVIEPKFTLYPSFEEPQLFNRSIRVHYASALPIRRLNGLWSCNRTLRIFKERHRRAPFDVVIIFNMKPPQVACASYAIRRLHLPVVLEYEDDKFVNVVGQQVNGIVFKYEDRASKRILASIAGGMAVSPHLMSQMPPEIPKLLLRGVVGSDIVRASEQSAGAKKNWVLFSGTHIESNGVAELIQAWRLMSDFGWELHITGYGGLTTQLREMAEGIPGLTFHGLVSREELVHLMSSAKICINPHAVSNTPGNVFAFKIIEYLGAGAHVVTTPMGKLENEFESGITYMPDNRPQTIAAFLSRLIREGGWERTAVYHAHARYGAAAVAQSLDTLLRRAVEGGRAAIGQGETA